MLDDGVCYADISHDSHVFLKNSLLEEMSNLDPDFYNLSIMTYSNSLFEMLGKMIGHKR